MQNLFHGLVLAIKIDMDMLRGAAAGFIATVPMTIAMESLRVILPAEQHRRMPPREIVDRSIDKTAATTGEAAQIDSGDRIALATLAHFAVGTLAGAIYGAAFARRGSALTGIAYGLGVWAAAYGIGLPSVGLHPAATHDTDDRNTVLIASHAVWGAVLGTLSQSKRF
jgi:hypothetical protein